MRNRFVTSRTRTTRSCSRSAWARRRVEYPGEELLGVWDSLPFVESLKTDRLPRVGRNAVVIGGGNTAIDCAREAARLGAAQKWHAGRGRGRGRVNVDLRT